MVLRHGADAARFHSAQRGVATRLRRAFPEYPQLALLTDRGVEPGYDLLERLPLGGVNMLQRQGIGYFEFLQP